MKQTTSYPLERIRGFAIAVLFLTAAVWNGGAQGLPEQADAFLEFADQVIDEEMERHGFLLVPTVVYLLTVLILPLAALIRKLRKREKTKVQRRILQFSWIFSLFALVVMMLFVLGDPSPLPYWSPVTSPAAVYGFPGFAFLPSVLALGVPVSWYFAIRRHTWQWGGHIAHTLFLLGTLLFLWFSVYNGLFFFVV
jgi:hypothetical protein